MDPQPARDGTGLMESPFAWQEAGGALGTPDRGRVVQCALSRVCGACGQSLGRPIAFLGTEEEVGRNAFHAPPLHLACAARLRARMPGTELVTTAGFEFVRASAEEEDRRPTFQPNSLL